MTYASIISKTEVYCDLFMNSMSHNSPNKQAAEILDRYNEDTIGSQYPTPTHEVVSADQHSYHVHFTYPNGDCVIFTGSRK